MFCGALSLVAWVYCSTIERLTVWIAGCFGFGYTLVGLVFDLLGLVLEGAGVLLGFGCGDFELPEVFLGCVNCNFLWLGCLGVGFDGFGCVGLWRFGCRALW